MGRRTVAGLAIVLCACGGSTEPKPAIAWRAAYQPFSDASPLRAPIAEDATIHPASARMIADLVAACGPDPGASCKFPRLAGAPERGRFFAEFGAPVFVAGPDERLRTVVCKRFPCGIAGITGDDTRALYNVPIPAGATAEPSVDGHMIVYDPAKEAAWEFFRASYSKEKDEWTTEGGIRWSLKSDGVDDVGEPGTAVGGGTPMLGTIVRPEEVREALRDGTNVIPHVLSGGYDSPRIGCFITPLVKVTDADDGRRWAIPEGAVIRLDPSLDLAGLDLNPAARVIARTLQIYGMVIRDDSGAFTIDVENVSSEDGAHPGRSGAWGALGVNKDSLRAIRAELFQVVAWAPQQAHGSNCP